MKIRGDYTPLITLFFSVRTVKYGPSFFHRFVAQARIAETVIAHYKGFPLKVKSKCKFAMLKKFIRSKLRAL